MLHPFCSFSSFFFLRGNDSSRDPIAARVGFRRVPLFRVSLFCTPLPSCGQHGPTRSRDRAATENWHERPRIGPIWIPILVATSVACRPLRPAPRELRAGMLCASQLPPDQKLWRFEAVPPRAMRRQARKGIFRCYTCGCDHTSTNAPDPIRTPKLSVLGRE